MDGDCNPKSSKDQSSGLGLARQYRYMLDYTVLGEDTLIIDHKKGRRKHTETGRAIGIGVFISLESSRQNTRARQGRGRRE